MKNKEINQDKILLDNIKSMNKNDLTDTDTKNVKSYLSTGRDFVDVSNITSPKDTFKIIKLKDMKSIYGADWTDVDFKNTKLYLSTDRDFVDISDVILPKNPRFFQKFTNGIVAGVSLPKIDLNEYDFKGISLYNVKFNKDTILPKNPDFFVNLNLLNSEKITFPEGDYSYMNFNGFKLTNSVFPKNSILPKDRTLFKKAFESDVSGLQLPYLGMKDYDFDGAQILFI